MYVMVKLKQGRKVVRETGVVIDGKALVVVLFPEYLEIRQKRGRSHRISYEDIWSGAVDIRVFRRWWQTEKRVGSRGAGEARVSDH